MNDKLQRQYLENTPAELQDLLYDGRKLQAIKLAQEKMGWDLKEAKEKVDVLNDKMHEQFPDAFSAKQKSGCSTIIFIFAILICGGSYFVFKLI